MRRTREQRILEYLRSHPEGVDDDALSAALSISPRQSVNSASRSLAARGLVDRIVADGKIHNFLRKQPAKTPRREHEFTAVIERDGDGFVALCPELDIASQGGTVEEARRNLHEALELFLETADDSEVTKRLHAEVFVTRLKVTVG